MIYLSIIVVLIILVGIINYCFSNDKNVSADTTDTSINPDIKTDTLINPDTKIDTLINPDIKTNTLINPDTKTDKNKIIVQFKGSQYDITNFAKKHPGGKNILIENNGNDIEKLMIENDHSKNAYKLLEKYLLK